MAISNIKLKKLIISKLKEGSSSKAIIKYLKDNNEWESINKQFKFDTDGEILYNVLYPITKYCPDNKIKFNAFSVGYTFCSPNCPCSITSKSQKVSKSKNNHSISKKKLINEKREQTNLTRYGTINPFKDGDKIKNAIKLKYGVTSPRKLSWVNDKIKATNIAKYGVDNPSKNVDIKNKQVKSWLKNRDKNIASYKRAFKLKYGVDNPRHVKWINDKIKATNIAKYGTEELFDSPTIQQRIKQGRINNYYNNLDERVSSTITPLFSKDDYVGSAQSYQWKCNTCNNKFYGKVHNGLTPICRKCNPYCISKFENEVKEFLELHTKIICNDREILDGKEIDILIPDKNIGIECDGVYWHSESKGKLRNYHLDKLTGCIEKNIALFHIYDIEWINKNKIIKSILLSKLGITTRIYARKCSIQAIDNKMKSQFLYDNHIQGNCNSSINYGLYYENKLHAVMTFGKSRFNKSVKWELLRYCQLNNMTVIGGASRLFKHIMNNHDINHIISFADRRLFSGNMYKQLGFSFSHNSQPSYHYYNKHSAIVLENRLKFQKHKLKNLLENFDQNLTEYQNMYNNGYERIWDCGNSVWILNK